MPLFLFDTLISEAVIRSLIGEKIVGTDYYILSLEIRPGNAIFVEMESSGPVSISDCVDISRQIEHNLDREAEDFSLQVSSPGLDKPLRDYRQYIKNVGRSLKIRLENGEELVGEILAANEEKITLHSRAKEAVEGKKRKEWVERDIVLTYPEIKQAKIQITFN